MSVTRVPRQRMRIRLRSPGFVIREDRLDDRLHIPPHMSGGAIIIEDTRHSIDERGTRCAADQSLNKLTADEGTYIRVIEHVVQTAFQFIIRSEYGLRSRRDIRDEIAISPGAGRNRVVAGVRQQVFLVVGMVLTTVRGNQWRMVEIVIGCQDIRRTCHIGGQLLKHVDRLQVDDCSVDVIAGE